MIAIQDILVNFWCSFGKQKHFSKVHRTPFGVIQPVICKCLTLSVLTFIYWFPPDDAYMRHYLTIISYVSGGTSFKLGRLLTEYVCKRCGDVCFNLGFLLLQCSQEQSKRPCDIDATSENCDCCVPNSSKRSYLFRTLQRSSNAPKKCS